MRFFGILIACGLSVFGWSTFPPHDVHAASPEESLQTDWLRQLELRLVPTVRSPSRMTPEIDAAGAVDGHIDGAWGFHTDIEERPWWQVDLQQIAAIDRIVLYNRGDGDFGERNARIRILFSDDGDEFAPVYEHDGTFFGGHSDEEPLEVPFEDAAARFVRLQLPGRSYFHLDQVEIYAGDENLARNQPATQSSVSQWSAPAQTAPRITAEIVAEVLQRGQRLADDLAARGVPVEDKQQRLLQIGQQVGEWGDEPEREARENLYFAAQRTIRQLSWRNPQLDFDDILFIKRAPTRFPHISDQHYGWWSQPGGGIYILENFRSESANLRCLTPDWPDGSFYGPELSWDGRRLLFAWCRFYPEVADVADKTDKEQLPEDSFYQIFEMNLADGEVRQLTFGRYDDFDARYLPDGRIAFLSTRKGTALQAGRESAARTLERTMPDSYVRCGGGNHRPVAVFTLHTMDAEGGDMVAISAFENFEWTPAVADDGRILYARWDYIDRFNGDFLSLWSTNPDGTNGQLVYGNFTSRPQCVFEARPVPGSNQLIFTATAHHSITGGSLVLLDRTRGTEYERPLTRLTPEVCFPETEGWPESYYVNPWPLCETYHLVAWSDRRLPKHTLMAADDPRNPRNAAGIYLYDAFGNLTLLHRDPEISSVSPIPIRRRQPPSVFPHTVDWDGPQRGGFLLQDIYQGMPEVPRGTIQQLRIVGVPPKVQPQMNSPRLGVSAEDPGKFILGTVPVEEDGSAHFEVPSGVPVLFQALDQDGLGIQTMRSLSYVQPGQTLGCVGCHEHRDTAPQPTAVPLAALREPSLPALEPEGTWPLRFDRLVQPVLDQHCIRCHSPDSRDPDASELDLTPARAYESLINFADRDLHNLAFERDRSIAGTMPAQNSRLYQLLTEPDGHYEVQLSKEDHHRLVVWMDTYAHVLGSFSEQQEQELVELREAFLGQ